MRGAVEDLFGPIVRQRGQWRDQSVPFLPGPLAELISFKSRGGAPAGINAAEHPAQFHEAPPTARVERFADQARHRRTSSRSETVSSSSSGPRTSTSTI